MEAVWSWNAMPGLPRLRSLNFTNVLRSPSIQQVPLLESKLESLTLGGLAFLMGQAFTMATVIALICAKATCQVFIKLIWISTPATQKSTRFFRSVSRIHQTFQDLSTKTWISWPSPAPYDSFVWATASTNPWSSLSCRTPWRSLSFGTNFNQHLEARDGWWMMLISHCGWLYRSMYVQINVHSWEIVEYSNWMI